MDNQDIINTLKIFNPPFKKKSVLELQQIMTFLKQELKIKNWSINYLDNFLEKNKIQISTLKFFYKEYSKRKKRLKTFEKLLSRYELREEKKIEKFMKTKIDSYIKIELIHKSQSEVTKFLKELKNIKIKYLVGKDNDFIEIISKNINTGYSKSTLRNYYYNNYVDTKD